MDDPFARYELPPGLADTVAIPIPDTPAVFYVQLPSNFRDEYQTAMMVAWNQKGFSTDDMQAKAAEFYKLQREMFFTHCIVKVDGLPEGMDIPGFLERYGLIKKVLFDRAMELTAEADEAMNDAMGKLNNLPVGKSSGRAKRDNTKH